MLALIIDGSSISSSFSSNHFGPKENAAKPCQPVTEYRDEFCDDCIETLPALVEEDAIPFVDVVEDVPSDIPLLRSEEEEEFFEAESISSSSSGSWRCNRPTAGDVTN